VVEGRGEDTGEVLDEESEGTDRAGDLGGVEWR
jgi:hypothetical protein